MILEQVFSNRAISLHYRINYSKVINELFDFESVFGSLILYS